MRTAKQFREVARNALTGRYWWAVLAALITSALGGATGPWTILHKFDADDLRRLPEQISDAVEQTPMLPALLSIIGVTALTLTILYSLAKLCVGSCMELGHDRYNVQLYTYSTVPKIGTLFSRFSIFWRALGLRLLMMLKILLWSLLLFIPGIVAAYRYAMAPYILAENPDVTAAEAIARSKQLMNGRKGRLFCLQLSFIGWYLLAGLTAGVGVIFLAPYVKAAETAFYMEITGRLPLPGQPQYTSQGNPQTNAQPDAAHAEMI